MIYLERKINNGYIFHVLDEYEFLEKYLHLKFLISLIRKNIGKPKKK